MEKTRIEVLNRRHFLLLSGATTMAALLTLPNHAGATPEQAMDAMKAAIGDVQPADGPMIKLELPEIAENGNTVPIKVSVDSPMTDADHVKAVHLFSEGNPAPEIASYKFSTKSGKAEASSRIRLAKTQNVIAVAEMSDGKFYMTKTQVKVTIGGCGG
mgnify:CR=1 FL=1